MKNADEHKQLLAQVAELEKKSINYFDVEKEFFLIDSDNLSQVRPKLYGYSIQRTGIYEDDNLTPEAIAGLDGRGCYVYVGVEGNDISKVPPKSYNHSIKHSGIYQETNLTQTEIDEVNRRGFYSYARVKDSKITIKQDLNGSWGIYLFRHGDYFALSNSFFRLVDHVKFKYPLTVNRDYCDTLVWVVLYGCNFAYSETAVNEIQKLERNAIVHIDIAKKSFQIELIDYKERSVLLDSEKGLAVVDRWVEFWGDVLRSLSQQTNFIQTDLSGGFDSRISFLLALQSGIDLNKVLIHTRLDKHHTYKEDYEIASKIVEHYGFKLNQPLPPSSFLNDSLSDVFNINFYGMLPDNANAVNLFKCKKLIDKTYTLSGYGGEIIREYWDKNYRKVEDFIRALVNVANNYCTDSKSSKFFNCVKKILNLAIRTVCDRYHIEDENSKHVLAHLYSETLCISHFGKWTLRRYFANNIYLSPTLDPDIRSVTINTPECLDQNLLMALLYVRYEPDLLTFPFDSNHFIAPETIEYAKKINERFPRRSVINNDKWGGVFNLQPRDNKTEQILALGCNNPALSNKIIQDALNAMFDSSKTYGSFIKYFDSDLYNNTASSRSLYHMFNVTGITKVLEDVEISQRNHAPYQDMKRFLEQDFAIIHNDEISDKFKPYLTARINIKLMTTDGDFQILSVSDEKANPWKPGWFQKDGIGYQIQSYAGKLDLTAKATVDGRIDLNLLGVDARAPEDNSKRIPYWIDYTRLTINGKTIFDTLTPAWHDKPYRYEFDAKANEEIKIHIEWQPHRSDT